MNTQGIAPESKKTVYNVYASDTLRNAPRKIQVQDFFFIFFLTLSAALQ